MRGDQTLGEKSTSILEGGKEWPTGNLSGVLQSEQPDVSTRVLDNAKGDNLVQTLKAHWPIVVLLLVVGYCVYHYKFKQG